MKTLTFACIAVVLATAATAPPAQARSLVGECNILAVKRYEPTGPQLIADIPKSMSAMSLDNVRFLDKKLGRKLVIQTVQAGRTETDTVRVAARLYNCTDHPQTVQLRTHFLDAEGFGSEPVTQWRTLFLEPRSMTVYSEMSIGREAVRHFLIELTEAR